MNVDDELTRLRRQLQEVRDRLDRRRPDPVQVPPAALRKMVVTAQLPKKVGTTVAVPGQAKDAVFNRTTRALAAGTGAAVDVYSDNLDKTVKVGAVITVYSWSGVLWVLGIDSCGNLI